MTAREIIERRLGHPLPPTRKLAPDERAAIRKLAQQLLIAAAERRREEHEHRQRGGYVGGV